MGLELYVDVRTDPTGASGINSDSSWVWHESWDDRQRLQARRDARSTSTTPRPRGRTLSTAFRRTRRGANQISQLQSGLFGVVNVQPEGAEYYRSQVLADDLGKATYYVWEIDLHRVAAHGVAPTCSSIPNLAERRQQAKLDFIYLPKQSGVYYLDDNDKTVTNMRDRHPARRQRVIPRKPEIDGVKYPVYT